jgi:hypothetical protein
MRYESKRQADDVALPNDFAIVKNVIGDLRFYGCQYLAKDTRAVFFLRVR